MQVTTIRLEGTLNEPGGLSFDQQTNSVLVANTNDHTLCRVSLENPHQVTAIGPKSTADVTDSLAHSAPTLAVRAADTLEVEMNIPDGKDINKAAPNKCVLSSPGLDDVIALMKGPTQFTFDLVNWKATVAKLTLKVFMCEKATGTCTVVSKSVTVQLKKDESLLPKINIDL